MVIVRFEGFENVSFKKYTRIETKVTVIVGTYALLYRSLDEQVFFDPGLVYDFPVELEASRKLFVIFGGLPFFGERIPSIFKDLGADVVDMVMSEIDTENAVVAAITAPGRCLHANYNHTENSVVLFR